MSLPISDGLCLAINYRLAPQYPFPCAIQDIVAACESEWTNFAFLADHPQLSDLFLIRPPEGAAHRPVKPEHIVVAGDSAGGGLSIALLQVLRDAGEPLPAGGVLISPWCDLTHSFPSIHTNTATVCPWPTDLPCFLIFVVGRYTTVRAVIL